MAGLVVALLSAFVPMASAQAPTGGRARPPRIYNTQRLVGHPPSIDGHLDDDAWKEGEWASDYTQQNPVEGGVPSKRTELKILYDEKNIYVAIRAYDDMAKISRFPTRRDVMAGDIVGVCFDSYFDKRAGFEFDITAAGTKIDLVLSNEGWDTTWDAVWDGKVAYEADAWTAEFRIPLNQLRYGPQEELVWGMHSWRWIDRLQEESQWNLIPRQGSGRLYNFGELHGIRGLKSQRHIELLPHVLGQVLSQPDQEGNPYVGNPQTTEAVGLDAKVGLSSNFTLDATLNPDFGQVEADPSVVNLTAYETFYDEKRPFFLEGKRIFNFGVAGTAIAGDDPGSLQGDQLFYSRRIGASPTVEPVVEDGAFLETPSASSIIGAVKVTGKTKDGLSLGLLQSLTKDEFANTWLGGTENRVPVAPTTNYVVGRIQKDWDQGNTILGGMFTSTHRFLPDEATLYQLPRDAFTAGLDAIRFFDNRSYVVEAKGIFTRVSGDTTAMQALQTDAVHYYQRPDAQYLGVDPNATSMTGGAGTLRLARYGNSKWQWSEEFRALSPGLELNDVGYLRQADLILNEAKAAFQETTPRGAFRTYTLSVTRDDTWDFGGVKTSGNTDFEASGQFKNLWGLTGGVNVSETPTDTRLLRGGPAMRTSGFVNAKIGAYTNQSKLFSAILSAQRQFAMEANGSKDEVTTEIDGRPVRQANFSLIADYQHNVDDLQYAGTAYRNDTPAYLLGRIDQNTISLTLRANVFLTPDLTIEFYGSPFVSNGTYGEFKRATSPLAASYGDRFHSFAPGEIAYAPALNAYQVNEGGSTYTFSNPDFDFRQFRSNLVVRWEFKPGSTVFLVWSQARTDQEVFGKSLPSSLDALRSVPGTNVFLVKLSYWFGL